MNKIVNKVSIFLKQNKLEILLVFISFILFFVSFRWNVFGIVDDVKFDTFDVWDESFVWGRLIESQKSGIFSHAGMAGRVSDPTLKSQPGSALRARQIIAYKNGDNSSFDDFVVYKSQTGGQLMVLGFLNNYILPSFNGTQKVSIIYTFNSILSAIVVSILILWFYKEFKGIVSIVVLTGLLMAKHFITFGRNPWWAFYSFYLPFIILLFVFKKFSIKKRKQFIIVDYIRIFGAIMLGMLLKIFLNGYEFITSSVIMTSVPIVYYAIKDKWNIPKFFKVGVVYVLAIVTVIFMGFMVLTLQISNEQNSSYTEAFQHITYSYRKRTTVPGAVVKTMPEPIQLSLTSTRREVFHTYLIYPYFKFTKCGSYINYFSIITILLTISVGNVLIGVDRKNSRRISTGLTTIFSILAPISWFIIFKAHAYIHTHLDFIVWYMPFIIWGFTNVGIWLQEWWLLLKNQCIIPTYKRFFRKYLNQIYESS